MLPFHTSPGCDQKGQLLTLLNKKSEERKQRRAGGMLSLHFGKW